MRAVMSLVLVALCAGAAPAELTHQGRVLDAAGAPIEGMHDLTVGLYSSATGGNALWSETESVRLRQGYYSLALGDELAFPDDLFGSGALWVGVSVDGVPQGTRQPLTSTPFALRAATADTLSGTAASAFVRRFTGESPSLAAGDAIDIVHDGGTHFVDVTTWYFDGSVWRDAAQVREAVCSACGDGSDGEYRPTGNTTLAGGTYQFTDFVIPDGVTVTVNGSQPLEIQATGTVQIDGALRLDGGNGGRGAEGNSPGGSAGTGTAGGANGGLGGWYNGSSYIAAIAGSGAGGGRTPPEFNAVSAGPGGGGGGYASTGSTGGTATCCSSRCGSSRSWAGGSGGSPYGSVPLDSLLGGSGGAGGGFGGADNGAGGGGGAGGGALKITAPIIVVSGAVSADGGNGGDAWPGRDGGGGAGGSGGTVWLRGTSVQIDGSISAVGGTGGTTSIGGSCGLGGVGGTGSAGRVQVDALTLQGSATPSPITTGSVDGLPDAVGTPAFETVQVDDNTVRVTNTGQEAYPVKVLVIR